MSLCRAVLLTTFLLALSAPLSAQPKVRFPTGKECAAKMTVPPGFVVKCFAAEPDVVNPIALDFDHQGRLYVLECLEYPQKGKYPAQLPPIKDGRVGHGRDRIRVFEDTDGDGVADKVSVFAEGLNLATGLAYGHGGVFVGQAPELLFLQDTDGDGKADRRTVLLDGWGFQDTHETLNSFLWGPDGWLYGCHGVFTHSRVGKPGTPNDQRIPLNAALWRYHPISQKFEVFSEGTSNPWAYDYDEHGSGFITACVIPHLYHTISGGLYRRQAGQNFNRFAYGEIREICDHVHYWGPSSHIGNKDPRRFEVGGGHAHSACLIYQGGAYPKEWTGLVYMNNLHGARINTDVLKRHGATYIGSHGKDFLIANDPNFRAIQLRTGPDGSIFMIDWYDPQICHNTDPRIWDRDHGRIFKVEFRDAPPRKPTDVSKLPGKALLDLLCDDNCWWWRKALLVLAERRDAAAAAALRQMVRNEPNPLHALRALWGLYGSGAFDQAFGRECLAHRDSWVRAWAVRFLAEGAARPDADTWNALLKLAQEDPAAEVRLELASACQRWRRLGHDPNGVLLRLMQRDDAKDPVLPFMIWLAFEPSVAAADYQQRLEELRPLAASPLVRDAILPRTIRRLASTGDPKHLEAVLVFLNKLDGDVPAKIAGLDGLLEALRGQRLEPPEVWKRGDINLANVRNAALIRRVRQLGVHFGDPAAARAAEADAQSAELPMDERLAAIQQVALARLPSSVEPLLALAQSQEPVEVRRESLRALGNFDKDDIAARLLTSWMKLPPLLQREAIGLLSSRRSWAHALVDAIARKTIARQELTEGDVRRLLALRDHELTKKIELHWGKLREGTPAQLEQQLARLRGQLMDQPADRAAGKAVFEKNCMVCHKLHGQGHDVGPDLSGAHRRDPEYLLINILDPNRVVGRDYYTAIAETKSGALTQGLLVEDAPQRITLKGEQGKLTTIARADLFAFKVEERSLMPEGLPNNMTEQQFRDLVAYLMEDPFLAKGQVAGPFKMALDYKSPIEENLADPLKTDGIRWKPFHLGPAAVIDMEKLGVLGPPTDSVAFVYVEVMSPRTAKTTLELAADDNVLLYLNGREVFRRTRAQQPTRTELELKEGVNRFLFKVHNIYGPSFLWARIADPERVLELK